MFLFQDSCVLTDEQIGADNGIENQLWYFREDYFFNSHHQFWHLYHTQHREFIPDRSGELFYFMHHEFLARQDFLMKLFLQRTKLRQIYDFLSINRYWNERSSAGVDIFPTFEFENDTIIPEAYNSHLTLASAGFCPPPRPPNQQIRVSIETTGVLHFKT